MGDDDDYGYDGWGGLKALVAFDVCARSIMCMDIINVIVNRIIMIMGVRGRACCIPLRFCGPSLILRLACRL